MTGQTGQAPQVTFAEYGEAIGDAIAVLRNNAIAAGTHARVPTCPGWTVLDLVVHLGVIQRWAAASIAGADPRDAARRQSSDAAAGRRAVDPLDWLDDGQVDLLNALAGAPGGVNVSLFVDRVPTDREAWARRQAHEATVHAVDVMAARLGAPPAASQTWIPPRLAADGIDELLTGFVTRRSSALRSEQPLILHARTNDTGHAWTVGIGSEPAVTTRHLRGAGGQADATFSGDAVPLYLALWNRGDEICVTGRPGFENFLDRWREQVRIS